MQNENVPKIRELAARGLNITRIAAEIGISKTRVCQLVKKHKIETPGSTPHRKTINNMELARAKSGMLPLSYMLKVMRDPTAHINRRDDMAKAAAPYLHPRLASVEVKAEHTIKKVAREPMSREAWAAKYALPAPMTIDVVPNGNGSAH